MQQSVFLLSVIKVIDYLLEDFDSLNISFICKVFMLVIIWGLIKLSQGIINIFLQW